MERLYVRCAGEAGPAEIEQLDDLFVGYACRCLQMLAISSRTKHTNTNASPRYEMEMRTDTRAETPSAGYSRMNWATFVVCWRW